MLCFLTLALADDAEPKDPNIYEDRFDNEHIYQMRYLEQRLYCTKLPHATHELGLTHVALGFVDVDTNEEMVLEYTNVPTNDSENISIQNPQITIDQDTNLARFDWQITHSVFIRPLINLSVCRWEAQTIVHNGVSGKVLNQLLKEYAVPFSDGNGTIYKLFGIRTHSNMQQYEQFYSVNCHDFVWGAMQYMKEKLNVTFDNNRVGGRNYAFYLINGSKTQWLPRKLDLNDPSDNQIALNYYSNKSNTLFSQQFEAHNNKLGIDLKSLRQPHQIVFLSPDNDYYVFTTKELPYIWYKVDKQIFPGTINGTQE